MSSLPPSIARSAQLLCLCSTLFLLTGCAATHAPEALAGPHFSVLTYNVNYGGPRRSARSLR